MGFLQHAHSGWRWIVLAAMVLAVCHAAFHLIKNHKFEFKDRRPGLWGLIASHIQLLLGIILYFISPKVIFDNTTMSNAMHRFFALEHPLVMILSVVLVTIGFSRAKKRIGTPSGYNQIFWFYLIALALILSRTPFPGYGYGTSWF